MFYATGDTCSPLKHTGLSQLSRYALLYIPLPPLIMGLYAYLFLACNAHEILTLTVKVSIHSHDFGLIQRKLKKANLTLFTTLIESNCGSQ
ncbi:hypothetical protein VIMY103929_12395 [Vibrio mytili]